MNLIQKILPAIENFHLLGYWIAFFAVLLETIIGIGLIIPGSTIILFMGALAAKGYFDLGDLLWFATIAAIIGDNINYFIGKKYGSRFLEKGFWFLGPAHFKKGKSFFENHGSKSVFIGRFIPSVKEVVPLIAGTFGMKRLTFTIWNIFGAIGWSMLWVLPGYFFATSLDVAKLWLTRSGFFLLALVVIFILLYLLKLILVRKGKDFFSFLFSIYKSIEESLSKKPRVQKFVEKHERFFLFLQKRVARDNFYGLPLTLLSLSFFYVMALLSGTAENVINSDIVVSTDIRVANLLTIFRTAEITKVFIWITLLGKGEIVVIFTIATIFILWLWKKQLYIIPLLLSIIGSDLFTFIGKSVFHRERPDVAVYLENSFSFPSGHATVAVAFYGFLTYFLIRNTKNWTRKFNIFFVSVSVILLIGFSRLYLGVHYLSDVWGGYLAGTIWLIIAISLSEYLLSEKHTNKAFYLNAEKKFLTAGIIIISIGLYICFSLQYKIPTSILPQEKSKLITNNVLETLKTDNLAYTETLLGDKKEPLNFIVVTKNDSQLVNLFKHANWFLSDNIDVFSIYKITKSTLTKGNYPQAPMTPDFWNSEINSFGFEKVTTSNNIRVWYHVRFWKTNYITKNGANIYVGTASFDNGVKWKIKHKMNPDIDAGREFLFSELEKTSLVTSNEKQQFIDPIVTDNSYEDQFFTDGEIHVLSTD